MKNIVPILLLLLAPACRQGAKPAMATGVVYYDSAHVDRGLNLMDLKKRSLLIDMHGKVLKEVPYGFIKVLDDGTMLGATDSALVKFDVNSKVIWKLPLDNIHHEITVDENGNIYLLSLEKEEVLNLKIRIDVVEIFSPEGKMIYKWSLFDHLNDYFAAISKSALLKDIPEPFDSLKGIKEYVSQAPERFFIKSRNHQDSLFCFEISHINSMQVLPENEVSKHIPAFKKGNILLSFNPYACYGILDTGTRKIEWVGYLPEGTRLHNVTLTPQGTILVFQNSTETNFWSADMDGDTTGYIKDIYGVISPTHKFMRSAARPWVSISEYDPLTNRKVWEYTAEPRESMKAAFLGSAQRLPNGNTFVFASTEEEGGKGFELTPQKKIVWLYRPTEKDDQTPLPSAAYRMTRIKSDVAERMIKQMK